MENFENQIQFADLNKLQDNPGSTYGYVGVENNVVPFEPQIMLPNPQLNPNLFFGYAKLDTVKLAMISTTIRYMILFRILITLLYLTCIELTFVFFTPVVLLDLIGFFSSKSLNFCWSVVYAVFLILNLCVRGIGIILFGMALSFTNSDCYGCYCWKLSLIKLIIGFLLVFIYEIFQVVVQFKFIKVLKNLTEEKKKLVLDMINSEDLSLCFCCRF
ncbi:hypothetical protein SteCoe_32002 [Stentor coeruleus]|uniref:Uncharacterized protein n=1 Tax=Stentor coeruleus TaxID=5963 RepID=A0A1R2B046_9CILI|nr:hypothetical protein SteCoe_32002 [Stentor coeruleus]